MSVFGSPFPKPAAPQSLVPPSPPWRAPLVAFVVCVAVGAALVNWRAWSSASRARAAARSEAAARAAALEVQLGHAASAAQALALAIKHSNGAAALSFAAIASDLRTAYPYLATIELQPNGIVSAVDPKTGNERAIGFNVLKDPAYGPAAQAALKRRALMVSGPVGLYQGGTGMIARAPVFLPGTAGREQFWGFAAASVRLPEAAVRARLDELPPLGYRYALYQTASDGRKPVLLAGRGVSPGNSVQVPVRVGSVELALAVEPLRGWTDGWATALEAVLVLAVAILAGLVAMVHRARNDAEAAIADAERRVATENAGLNRAQDDARRAQEELSVAEAELTRARTALQQALTDAAGEKARLDSALVESRAEATVAHKKLREAERVTTELRTALETSQKSALDAAQAQAARLEAVQRAAREAADAGAAKFASALREAREQAEAASARVASLEQSNRELARLAATAERAERRAAELARSLEQARHELRRERQHPDSSAPVENDQAPGEEPTAAPEPLPEPAHEDGEGQAETSESSAVAEDFPGTEDPTDTPAAGVLAPEPEPAAPKPARAVRRKPRRPDPQIDLFGTGVHAGPPEEPETGEAQDHAGEEAAESEPKRPARRLPASPPVNVAELRTAVHQILPLLVDGDPGAKDCLRDNRATFRSAFTPEAYEQFEQAIKARQFESALEQLRRAARKEGMNL